MVHFIPPQQNILESIAKRECRVAAVEVLQLNCRQSKRIRISCCVEPVIIPGHLVRQVSMNIDRNRRVRPPVIEIESARRRKWV